MRRAALALLLTLTACGGGGGDAQPAATTAAPSATPASAAPTLLAEVKVVVDAVEATYAACPCAVSVRAGAFATRDNHYNDVWTGVYDPKAGTATLRPRSAPEVEARFVQGAAYIRLTDGVWRRLDFSKLPVEPRNALASLALADPAMGFATARAVTFAQETQTIGRGTIHDVEHDLARAATLMGPSAELFRRFFPEPSMYGNVIVKDGRLVSVGLNAHPGNWSYDASLDVTKTGVPSPKVEAPASAVTVDVATFTGS